MRLADAFQAGRDWISDGDFVLTGTCGLQQRVDEITIDVGVDLTVYDCARCDLALQPPGTGLDDAELLLGTPNFFLALRDL